MLERQAHDVADEVMRRADPVSGRAALRAVGTVFRSARSQANGASADVAAVVSRGVTGPGRSLDAGTRVFMEQRLGRDLGGVRLFTDAAAAASARSLDAHAYTFGNAIVFGAGRYRPDSERGKRLLAHELAHVVQQQADVRSATLVQRDCSDPDFCKPFLTWHEAATAEALLRQFYLPAEEQAFNADTRALYDSFLSRAPGDSLAPVEFNTAGNGVVSSFANSGDTANDQDAIIDLIGARLSSAPGPLADNTPTTMPVDVFVTRAELDSRPINYSNPLAIAGHIAGGIGSSDAGVDYRKVLRGDATLERVPLVGSAGYVRVETTLRYEVFDAIDFCPGDCGSPAEQLVTIPMSRLEASGQAYDVPFKVTFTPPSRSKKFFFV